VGLGEQAGDDQPARRRQGGVLTVPGDPEAHILDVATGREVGTLRLGDDVLALQFQRHSRYVTLLRQGNVIEMWDRVTGRRVTVRYAA
jgi:hypothetical protein